MMQTLQSTDLIIFNDQGLTDLSLLPNSNLTTSCNSVAIISPNKIEPSGASSKLTVYSDFTDYYEIYSKLESVVNNLQSPNLLIIRVGVKPTAKFCDYLNSMLDKPLTLFFSRKDYPCPGGHMADLIVEPLFPAAVFIDRGASMTEEFFKSRYLELTFWETAIRICKRIQPAPADINQDLLLRKTPEPNPVTSYRNHLARTEPDRAKELRDDRIEWNEHLSNLYAAVIDEHQEVFAAYCSTLIPSLHSKNLDLSEWKRILTTPGGEAPALLPSWKLSVKLLIKQISTLVLRERKHGSKPL